MNTLAGLQLIRIPVVGPSEWLYLLVTSVTGVRSLAHSRGSLFLSVMVDCDIDEQVRRIDNPDRIVRLKGSDPEGYRRHRKQTKLYQPPADEVVHIDTTEVGPRDNAERIYETLLSRGLRQPEA